MFTFLMSLVLAGIIGYVSERLGFTQNGVLPSIMVCVGGAFLFFVVRVMFGFSFGSPGLDAVAASVGALLLVPTHYRPIQRKGRSTRGRRHRR
ncbi:MAG: hypothetical protein AAGJ96_02815 [Pseudomonadota bacterium]